MRLQQKFIEWVAAVIPSEKPIYLGGASAENVTSCWKVSCTEGAVEFESLRNDHEEADDRMLYHINQAVSHERCLKELSLLLRTQMCLSVPCITSTAGYIVACKRCG